MGAFFVMKVYCVPPDVEGQVRELLHYCEQEIKLVVGHNFEDIPVGIALVSDVSTYHLGDMIWAEGEFRGDSAVRSLSWEYLHDLSGRLLERINLFVDLNVNTKERLGEPELVRCNSVAVTIGCENGPVTATCHRTV